MAVRISNQSRLVSARVAGVAFLLYIAAGISSMALSDESSVTDVLDLLMGFSALTLGVTLYAITREEQPILALFAMTCRIAEALSDGDEAAVFFAVGSTVFSWLLLRGRMIPAPLAWLGLIASVLLVVILPLQVAGLFGGSMSWSASITWYVWLPMLVFELVLSIWLLIKGVNVEQWQKRAAEAA